MKWPWLALLVLVGCTSGEEYGRGQQNCPEGQVFDYVSRSCIVREEVMVKVPVPTTTLIQFGEKDAAAIYYLDYEDPLFRRAVACQVRILPTDVDNLKDDRQDPYFIIRNNACSCSAAGKCWINIGPNPITNSYRYGDYRSFQYRVTAEAISISTRWSEWQDVIVDVRPVNDAPLWINPSPTTEDSLAYLTHTVDEPRNYYDETVTSEVGEIILDGNCPGQATAEEQAACYQALQAEDTIDERGFEFKDTANPWCRGNTSCKTVYQFYNPNIKNGDPREEIVPGSGLYRLPIRNHYSPGHEIVGYLSGCLDLAFSEGIDDLSCEYEFVDLDFNTKGDDNSLLKFGYYACDRGPAAEKVVQCTPAPRSFYLRINPTTDYPYFKEDLPVQAVPENRKTGEFTTATITFKLAGAHNNEGDQHRLKYRWYGSSTPWKTLYDSTAEAGAGGVVAGHDIDIYLSDDYGLAHATIANCRKADESTPTLPVLTCDLTLEDGFPHEQVPLVFNLQAYLEDEIDPITEDYVLTSKVVPGQISVTYLNDIPILPATGQDEGYDEDEHKFKFVFDEPTDHLAKTYTFNLPFGIDEEDQTLIPSLNALKTYQRPGMYLFTLQACTSGEGAGNFILPDTARYKLGEPFTTDDGLATITCGIAETASAETATSLSCVLQPLDGNVATAEPYTLCYAATDAANQLSNAQNIEVTIQEEDDYPVICEYTKFSATDYECGVAGCIGEWSPDQEGIVIGHKKNGGKVYYYQKGRSLCWWADRNDEVPQWQVLATSAHISDHVINEKSELVINNIMVDEGGGATEDGQRLRITQVTSSNGVLLPAENITLSYPAGFNFNTEMNPPLPYALMAGDNPAKSGDEYPLMLKAKPVSGKYGQSVITLTVEDYAEDDTTYAHPLSVTTVSFTLTVEKVSVIHRGWKNVRAVGPRVDKDGEVQEREGKYVCNYSRGSCRMENKAYQDCTGLGDPNKNGLNKDQPYVGAIYNTIFYDRENKQCYIYQPTDDDVSTPWVPFETYCNVSGAVDEPACAQLGDKTSNSCVMAGIGEEIIPKAAHHYAYDPEDQICYRSVKKGDGSFAWQSYVSTAEVQIEWNLFSISGRGAIAGYNVFRREAQEVFDYEHPINRTMLAANVTSYLDNNENSFFAPVPGTVYYYEVRAVVNGISTRADEDMSEIRVIAPPPNRAFVSRDMANKAMCTMLGKTAEEIDSDHHYRCAYIGPGDKVVDIGDNQTLSVYDIGHDLIVDAFEAGCNYTSAPVCNTSDHTCLGREDPAGTVQVIDERYYGKAIYYNRSNGVCYRHASGTNWLPLDSVTELAQTNVTNDFAQVGATLKSYYVPELPPLTNVTQAYAHYFCKQQNISEGTETTQMDKIIGLRPERTIAGHLPSRKEQMAYSLWPQQEFTSNSYDDVHAEITGTENGLSLSLDYPKCNSFYANGLEDFYTDIGIPNYERFFSVAGTYSSNIRSMQTGGRYTKKCVSRFGIQDMVGNVSEWIVNQMVAESREINRSTGESIYRYLQWRGIKKDDPGTTLRTIDGTIMNEPLTGLIDEVDDEFAPHGSTLLPVPPEEEEEEDPEGPSYDDDGAEPAPVPEVPTEAFDNYYLNDNIIISNLGDPDVVSGIGPCALRTIEETSYQFCGGDLDHAKLADKDYSAGYFAIPLGLPVGCKYIDLVANGTLVSEVPPYLLEVGTKIQSQHLHSDGMNYNFQTPAEGVPVDPHKLYNGDDIDLGHRQIAAMAAGGNYTDDTASGVYTLELRPEHDRDVRIGLRCVFSVDDEAYEDYQ